MSERGRYIVLEGPEGVGKSTQVQKLVGSLALEGIVARSDIREPGGTPMAEEIRTLLKNQELGRLALTNLMLFSAARAETLTVIKSALDEGEWVIADRNHTSSLVHQVYAEGVEHDTYASVTRPLTKICEPDLTLIMMAPEEQRQRQQRGRGTVDYFEKLGEDYHHKVRQGYVRASSYAGNYLLDAEGEIDEVHERIWDWVMPLINDEPHPRALHDQAQALTEKYEKEV